MSDLPPTPTTFLTAGVVTPSGAHAAGPPPSGQERFWHKMFTRTRLAIFVAILFGLIFAGIGGVAEYPKKSLYSSTTIMLIDNPAALALQGNDTAYYQLSELRYKYTALVNTSAMAAPVAGRLGLTEKEVAGSVYATAPLTSLLIDVGASSKSAVGAEVLSEDMAEEITRYVKLQNTQYNIPANDQFILSIIQNASPGHRTSRSKTYVATIAAVLAVIGFLLGFVVTQLIRNRKLAV